MINIPMVRIGDLELNLIQGGMGVGISGARMASAVAEEGGMGTIASVGLGLLKGYFDEAILSARVGNKWKGLSGIEKKVLRDKIYAEMNSVALTEEIRAARKMTNGVIAVNILHALTDYSSLVETAVRENVDAIVVGAGIPKDLPQYLIGRRDIKLIPIVSSARVASMICKTWRRYRYLPDAIIVEGPKAGGHLGYDREARRDKDGRVKHNRYLENPDFVENGLEWILPEVIAAVGPKIPVIATGGVYYGVDVKRVLDLGASGVQIATRVSASKESGGGEKFKQTIINAKEEDIILVNSPVGMPGRAIKNDYIEGVNGKKIPFGCSVHCLRSCTRRGADYCIADALINAQKGIMEKGFAFAGTNAHLVTESLSVREIFREIEQEYNAAC